jgi:nicotinate-nucleotide--dimethylbenzimidazole phosphoribosyltransferase
VILDGVVSGACAMVAHRVAYRCAKWWQAGHLSVEPAHEYVLARLQLEPLLDYQLRLGEGTGALLALPLVRAAQATLAEMATFEDAGVSSLPPIDDTSTLADNEQDDEQDDADHFGRR